MPAWDLREVDIEAGQQKVIPFSFKSDSYIVYARGTVPIPGIRIRPGTSIGTSALELIGDGSVALPAKPGQEEYIALENKTTETQHLFIIGSQGVLPTIIGTTGVAPLAETHNILDGSVHLDTRAGTVVKGDMVIGIDVDGVLLWQRLPRGITGQVLVVQADNSLAWAAAAAGAPDYINIRDEKVSGTDGGSSAAGVWTTRNLNTEAADTGGFASVGGNLITLAAGAYRIRASSPAFRVDAHQIRVRDQTGGTILLIGTSVYADAVNNVHNRSIVEGRFTLAAQSDIAIQHRTSLTQPGNGFGNSVGWGTEVYTIVELRREA